MTTTKDVDKMQMAIRHWVLNIMASIFIISGIVFLIKMWWLLGISTLIASIILYNISSKLKHFRTEYYNHLLKNLEEEIRNKVNNILSVEDKEKMLIKLQAEKETSETVLNAEKERILNSLGQTTFILIVLTSILFFKYDFKWYFSIPLAIVIGGVVPYLLFGLGLLITKLIFHERKM
ncbi:MAG: hypothetical protein WCL51_05615 [Bacteroidota bacterium]